MMERSKCALTHPQIASGRCPHCGAVVADVSTTPEAASGTCGVRWNIARLLEDLDRDDEFSRLTTIFNLSDHLPPLEHALPVVRKAMHDRSERVRDRALTASVLKFDNHSPAPADTKRPAEVALSAMERTE